MTPKCSGTLVQTTSFLWQLTLGTSWLVKCQAGTTDLQPCRCPCLAMRWRREECVEDPNKTADAADSPKLSKAADSVVRLRRWEKYLGRDVLPCSIKKWWVETHIASRYRAPSMQNLKMSLDDRSIWHDDFQTFQIQSRSDHPWDRAIKRGKTHKLDTTKHTWAPVKWVELTYPYSADLVRPSNVRDAAPRGYPVGPGSHTAEAADTSALAIKFNISL